MKFTCTFPLVLALPALALAVAVPACEKKAESPAKPSANTGGHAAGDGHDHKDGDDHDHRDGHGHGPRTELGSQSAGGMTIVAAREGGVTPGGEATFDIAVTGGAGRPAAVRVWVGTQDGKGSIKGKAEAEGDGWHAHAEVPKPLPAGSKLWVEVETAKGEKHVVGFDLKS
ncbi:MAG: hypothetical protein KF864_14070 [Phycisphaeraceae bacterium]|nr:hypothetical protein [Phycisphaeraceae bacterium]MBX3404428.1 hypothetical protein [Phycisphaeraceae bacterium]MBX3435724.1 hypothetical protein [Pirellulales bacterium]MCW5775367.1 hypothetical protein [Phycisphaeraceae bacterium]